MASIRIRTKLESETLTLPELKQWVGKTVEIEVTELPDRLNAERWEAASDAALQLTDYDFNAADQQRAFDQFHGEDHLR